MTADIEGEVGVLGGGPAGSVIARRLAELGHDTLLVDRTDESALPRAESLSPSVLPILESVRLRETVDAAVFCRESRALLRWTRPEVEVKHFESAPCALVDRSLFDSRLRQAAAKSGARLETTASARTPRRHPAGGWLVPIAGAAGPTTMRVKFLVDARGRRPRASANNDAPRTAAMSGSFEGHYPAIETRIEAGADEWYWGTPLPDDRYGATIFLNASRIAGLGGDARLQLYRHLLTRSRLLAGVFRAKATGPISVRDATSRIAKDLVGNDFIRIGEAAVAVDPLSSQGIQLALLSAIQGSAAVHTILTARCDSLAAFEFYRDRQQMAAAKGRLNGARFYRTQPNQTSFWKDRSSAAEEDLTVAQELPAASEMAQQADARISAALRIVEVPVLSGSLIRRARAICHPRLELPVAYLGNVALAPLIERARGALGSEQILSRWSLDLPPETARQVMAWMCSVGIVDSGLDGSQNSPTSARC